MSQGFVFAAEQELGFTANGADWIQRNFLGGFVSAANLHKQSHSYQVLSRWRGFLQPPDTPNFYIM